MAEHEERLMKSLRRRRPRRRRRRSRPAAHPAVDHEIIKVHRADDRADHRLDLCVHRA